MEIVIHSLRLRAVIGVEGVNTIWLSDWGNRQVVYVEGEPVVSNKRIDISQLPDIEQPKEERRPDHSYRAVKERNKFFGRRK